LSRTRNHPAYIYRAIVSDLDVAKGILDDVIEKIMGGRSSPSRPTSTRYHK